MPWELKEKSAPLNPVRDSLHQHAMLWAFKGSKRKLPSGHQSSRLLGGPSLKAGDSWLWGMLTGTEAVGTQKF